MQEMVYVGNDRLIGEVIGITDGFTTIQVYEVTTGLRPGEPVHTTGTPMSVTLGPGIIKNIFDGIERPLKKSKKPPARLSIAAAAWIRSIPTAGGT